MIQDANTKRRERGLCVLDGFETDVVIDCGSAMRNPRAISQWLPNSNALADAGSGCEQSAAFQRSARDFNLHHSNRETFECRKCDAGALRNSLCFNVDGKPPAQSRLEARYVVTRNFNQACH